MKWGAIIAAAGRGTRLQRPKQLLDVAGSPRLVNLGGATFGGRGAVFGRSDRAVTQTEQQIVAQGAGEQIGARADIADPAAGHCGSCTTLAQCTVDFCSGTQPGDDLRNCLATFCDAKLLPSYVFDRAVALGPCMTQCASVCKF